MPLLGLEPRRDSFAIRGYVLLAFCVLGECLVESTLAHLGALITICPPSRKHGRKVLGFTHGSDLLNRMRLPGTSEQRISGQAKRSG
jgi:hypothetical protein